ncbi:lipid A deacylase LpxR family protein [Marinilabiliaceae bacterium N1Y90]|nr:lipid A deacylase LpxR family protein [Marinilabiliaceae bacterium N1Y90]
MVFSKAYSQQVINNKVYKLGWDNDVFMMTDYYYSQGLSFHFYNPLLKHNPVNLILLKPKQYDKVIYGFMIDQRTYTPQDISSDVVQYSDRPYAGVLLLTSKSIAANTDKGWMFASELDIGVMGPASGAGHVQYRYHDLSNNQLPNGWVYQQYNWPVINYNFEASKELYSSNSFELYGKGKARVGTLHDDASVSMMLRVGKMESYMESLGLPLQSNSKNWQLYFSAEPSLSYVAYNGTLQGGWHRNPKIHYLEYSEMSPIVARVRTGVGLVYKSFGLSFDLFYNTKEFKTGTDHWYHSTRLFITF